MEQMNFHKQKLYALIAAAVGLIGMFLPWWKVDFGFVDGSINGMHDPHDLGIVAFIGFIGAGIFSFIGDKAKPFEGQNKTIAAACFAGAAAICLIEFLRQTEFASYGIWLCIIAGAAGAIIVWILKPEQLENKPPL